MVVEYKKLTRGNALSLLYQEFMTKLMEKAKKRPELKTMGFMGQHTSRLRQAKNKIMMECALTGKQYRKLIKQQRREAKNEQARSSVR